jgi:hypothetical protein
MYINEFIIPIYLYLAIIVAFLGRKTKLKFFRSLVLSLFLTPPITLIILILFFPARIDLSSKKIRKENV